MPVVAIVNRKGGSGKSTLATHLAAYLAHRGETVLLGDADRQQSMQAWLRLRKAQPHVPRIKGWSVEPRNFVRPPAGSGHVILDTPGGLRGFDLARVVMYADVVLMPVAHSVFDRHSAAACHDELLAMPRVASGRCKIGAVGMRLDARTRASDVLQAWATQRDLAYVGALRQTQNYVRCIEQGLSLFDLAPEKAATDLAQWAPILDWLAPLLQAAQQNADTVTRPSRPQHIPASVRADGADAELSVARAVPRATDLARPAAVGANVPADGAAPSRVGKLLDLLSVPRFLQRQV